MASQAKSNLLEQHQLNRPLNLLCSRRLGAAPRISARTTSSVRWTNASLRARRTLWMQARRTMLMCLASCPCARRWRRFSTDPSGAEYQAGNLIITAGVQESRFLTIQKIGERYDSIAVPTVVHPGVHKALGVRHLTAISLPINAKRGHLPTTEGIAARGSRGCRLIYLESPSRLSGAVYSSDEVAAIGKSCARMMPPQSGIRGCPFGSRALRLAGDDGRQADANRDHRRCLSRDRFGELVHRLYRGTRRLDSQHAIAEADHGDLHQYSHAVRRARSKQHLRRSA